MSSPFRLHLRNLPWDVMASVSVCVSSTAVGTDACSSDEDCELNGACSDKKCKCRSGWVGPSCGTLDVLPAPTAGAWPLHRYSEPTKSQMETFVKSENAARC